MVSRIGETVSLNADAMTQMSRRPIQFSKVEKFDSLMDKASK